MINRIIVLSALVLAFAMTINWHLKEPKTSEVPESIRNEPDLYMLNATIEQFGESGELQHTLSAQRFTHFPLTDITTMKIPSMSLGPTLISGDAQGTKAWQIDAKEGRIIPATNFREEVVELWSNVLAVQNANNGDFINIQTSSLTVYPEREYLETDKKVYIDNQTGRTTAAGMKAFLDSGRFMFFSTPSDRVVTIFLPE